MAQKMQKGKPKKFGLFLLPSLRHLCVLCVRYAGALIRPLSLART